MADGFEAERVIAEWIEYYHEERPHSALDTVARPRRRTAPRPHRRYRRL